MSQSISAGIVGATGAVGQELLGILAERNFPVGELRLLASPQSAGKSVVFRGEPFVIQATTEDSVSGLDVVFFSAGASRSREFAPAVLHSGGLVIDNSSAFRMDPEIPLVVPEINGELLQDGPRLVANPNCTAIMLLMAVAPLRRLGPISRLIVSTYQSISGAGAAAMEELLDQTRAVLAGEPAVPQILPHPCAFNVFSHNTPIGEDGLNEEESKVIAESRKILGEPNLAIQVTCVRVPVLRAHTETVVIEFAGSAPSLESVRTALRDAPGVQLVDDRATNTFPMPIEASGKDDVLVGRVRIDPSHPSAISLMVSGDQLRKGAALNAVQIAEVLALDPDRASGLSAASVGPKS